MKIKTWILSLLFCSALLLLAPPRTAFAAEVDSGNFGVDNSWTWVLDDEGTLTVSGTGNMPDFENTPDTDITPWHSHRTSIQKVVISEGVTSIGDNAFFAPNGEYAITQVELPEGLLSIGESSFYWCRNLTQVKLPDSVTSIGENAFNLCMSLTQVELPEGLLSMGKFAFGDCGKLREITLPASLATIGNYAFIGASSLTTVTCLGTQAPTLGREPFYSCNQLSTIYIPVGATGYDAAGWSTDKIKTRGAVIVQNSAGGTAEADKTTTVVQGDTVTLTANPDSGYHFKEWQTADGVTITDNQFLMPDKDVTITAVFEQHTYGSWVSDGSGRHTGTCTNQGCKQTTTEKCNNMDGTCDKCGYRCSNDSDDGSNYSSDNGDNNGSNNGNSNGNNGAGSDNNNSTNSNSNSRDNSGDGSASPQTGDSSSLWLWTSLLLSSLLCIIAVTATLRRKQKQNI